MSGGIAFLLAVCFCGTKAVDTDINHTLTIKGNAMNFEYEEGGEVTIKCEVVVDEELKRDLTVKWLHEGNELTDLPRQQPVYVGGEFTEDIPDNPEGSACGEKNCEEITKVLLADNSLKITGMKLEDIGEYKCEAVISKDGKVQQKVFSQVSTIYQRSPFPWWIIVVVLLIVIIMVIAVLLFLKYKRGWNSKGYYDIKDIEDTGVQSDKSDIYYKAESVTSDGKVTYKQQESTLME